MRGGVRLAERGEQTISISFTNAQRQSPWGGTTATLANNPMVIAVPRKEGHIVLDMAPAANIRLARCCNTRVIMNSCGASGYDSDGNISHDPVAIAASKRLLPFGFWKGSGLTMMIDLLVTVFGKGGQWLQTGSAAWGVRSASQVFIAIKPQDTQQTHSLIEEIFKAIKSSPPVNPDKPVVYPGENTLKMRNKNLKEGVLVDERSGLM